MICLTHDTDYMTPDGMERFLDEFTGPGTDTFFLWKPYPGMDWRGHEAQPHPFYDDLTDAEGKLRKFIDELGIPATGMRTHSCVYSHIVSGAAHRCGLRYVSVTSQLFRQDIKPYKEAWGVWEVPIYYMDNMDLCWPDNWPNDDHKPLSKDTIKRAFDGDGLKVFDIHPLHVALNTTSYEDYKTVRVKLQDGASPWDVALPGYGVRSFYEDLRTAMSDAGVKSKSLTEVVDLAEAGHFDR
ncbi:polysaccharide deacetylase WbmS family protein [Hyphobacterium marinum]|uniref:Uncharacterized protein n=1 Tax=Hyphobacterium marinum TaxID=3116574 RepID=A0ABU7LY36_9PROT|nr:hypothetical protein [Hyphobacterium sp. Y6023]MEE2566464.1 hypothetical protein [Hyphobacterium sp. Y6023]